MHTEEIYLQKISNNRKIRLNGEEYSHPCDDKALSLGVEANRKFYRICQSKAFQPLMRKSTKQANVSRHPFFDPVYDREHLETSAKALDYVQDSFHGLFTRVPDYKGSFITCLASNREAFGDYGENVKNWHDRISQDVPAISHAFVAPSSLGASNLQTMRGLEVISSDASGIIVRGLKAVSTGATAAEYVYVRDSRPADKSLKGLSFIVPMHAEGLKLICTQPVSTDRTFDSPLSYPISSAIDENDTLLLFDDVFIPSTDIFCADELSSERWFGQQSGFIERARLHGVIRVLKKLDLIKGFLAVAAPRMKPGGQQTKDILAEVELARNVLEGLRRIMLEEPVEKADGELLPNTGACASAYIMAPRLLADIRKKLCDGFAGALISVPSSADDFHPDEIQRVWGDSGDRKNLEKSLGYIRGVRELLLGEFGLRQELFEANYLGNLQLAYGNLFEEVRTSKQTQIAVARAGTFFAPQESLNS